MLFPSQPAAAEHDTADQKGRGALLASATQITHTQTQWNFLFIHLKTLWIDSFSIEI